MFPGAGGRPATRQRLSTASRSFRITMLRSRRLPMPAVGSAFSTSRSARLPGATAPRSGRTHCRATALVPAASTWVGVIPAATMSSASSRVLAPNRPRPLKVSLPSAMGTPACAHAPSDRSLIASTSRSARWCTRSRICRTLSTSPVKCSRAQGLPLKTVAAGCPSRPVIPQPVASSRGPRSAPEAIPDNQPSCLEGPRVGPVTPRARGAGPLTSGGTWKDPRESCPREGPSSFRPQVKVEKTITSRTPVGVAAPPQGARSRTLSRSFAAA